MYIADIAPAAKRGRLVGLLQFNIVAGILVASLANYAIGTLSFGAEEWRWKLGVATLPAVFFFITLFGIPQSPRWLIRRGFIEEARQIFTRIGEPDPDREVADVIRSVKSEDRTKVEPLFQRKYRRPIMLAIAIGFFNPMSGINAILSYLNDIFKHAGCDNVSSVLHTAPIALAGAHDRGPVSRGLTGCPRTRRHHARRHAAEDGVAGRRTLTSQQLQLQRDGDLMPHHYAARLQRHVKHHAEVPAIDFGGC